MTRIYNRSFRAEDALGKPIAGAQVTLWDAKTSGTQLTTGIQDLNGGDIAAGILTTDAWGYVPDFQDTADRAAIWAIGSATGTIAGVERVLLEPSDTDDRVTTLETQVAGLQARANVVLYAYDYGYRADGNSASAAANTSAIQNAVNALGTGGGTVVLPPGYGYITAPGIELTSRVWLRGAGHYATVLQLANGANCDMIRNHVSSDGVSDPNAMFCAVSDLALDGRGVHQTATSRGIRLDTNPSGTIGGADLAMDATHRITNVYIRNTHDEGIYSSGRSDTRIVGCKVSFAGADAFKVGFDTEVQGCIAEKPTKAGFTITGSSTRLTGCKAYICGQDSSAFNGQTAVPANGHGYQVTGTGIGEVTITACDAQQTSGHGFVVTGGAAGVVLAGCTAQEVSYGNGTTFVGFDVDGASNVVVTGVHKAADNVSGLRLVNGADRCDIAVAHVLMAGQTTLADALSSDTALLSSRVVVNGVTRSTIPAWAASTAYVTGQQVTYLGATYRATASFTSGASFSVSNWALVSSPLPATIVPSGQYVFPAVGASPGTSNSQGIGTLRTYPVYIPHAVTLTGIGAEVTTVGDAGSKIRLGIYAGTGNLTPGALVLDAGQIAGDSATVQTLTISQTLAPGIYWVCAVVQAVTTTQPTMRIFTPTGVGLPMSSAPSAGVSACAYTHGTSVPGALPANFSVGGLISSAPRLHLKG